MDVTAEAPLAHRMRGINIVNHVRGRSLALHDAFQGRSRWHPLNEYLMSRLQVRARIQMAHEGCTFALKFAPQMAISNDAEYCLLTNGGKMEVWDMSGIYTRRKRGELHGAKLAMSLRAHNDVCSACEWLPADRSETFELETPQEEGHPSTDSSTHMVTMPPFFTAGFDKVIKLFKRGKCVGEMVESDWVRFMSVGDDGRHLLSGSVNANIFGWDTNRLKPLFRIAMAHVPPPHLLASLQGINSINGLEWAHGSSTTFASGAGDGSVKLWDARQLDANSSSANAVGSIQAHNGKLNNVIWTQDNRYLVTSGRDDVIRLLDLRMIRDSSLTLPSSSPASNSSLVVREYTGHSCSGYNIQAAMDAHDSIIVTGSREGKIFIWDKETANVMTVLSGPVQPTHLVVPLPERCGPGLISATAVSAHIFVWAPFSTTEDSPECNLAPPPAHDDDTVIEVARQEALENTISQFGERFLRALRQEGPASRIFMDQDVRDAYAEHIRAALDRLGRAHLLMQQHPTDPNAQPQTTREAAHAALTSAAAHPTSQPARSATAGPSMSSPVAVSENDHVRNFVDPSSSDNGMHLEDMDDFDSSSSSSSVSTHNDASTSQSSQTSPLRRTYQQNPPRNAALVSSMQTRSRRTTASLRHSHPPHPTMPSSSSRSMDDSRMDEDVPD